MKNKIYYLSTCDTCKRILKELAPLDGIELLDIKTNPLTANQLTALREQAGSFEALFSKRARHYKERNLHEKTLNEEDFEVLILEHYTFLKRPVMLLEGHIFIGNSKKEIAAAKVIIHP